jgi:hypothetical protein
MTPKNSETNRGAILMVAGTAIFIAYAIVFIFRSFTGPGFQLGVDTLGGITPAELNPVVAAYISHLHVAAAGFIAATAIAAAALAWFGARSGQWWAWWTAVIAPVVGLAIGLPMHYMGLFSHNWVTHLGPVYLGTAVFVIGALIAFAGLIRKA